MAIIYSYPDNENLLLTDMLIGTSTIRINGRKKNITKNFTLEALGLFIQDNFPANTVPWGNITGTLSNQTDLQEALDEKQGNITLTTTGSSGPATFIADILNIPDYSAGYTVPTLQSVTDEGNTTTTDIIVDSALYESIISNNYITVTTKGTLSGIGLLSSGVVSFGNGSVYSYLSSDVTNLNVYFRLPNKLAGTYTLATTADIPVVTGFVPYTGATGNVNIGDYNYIGGNLELNGISTDGGSINLRQSASNTISGDGYTSIYSLGTDSVSFYLANNFDGKQFNFLTNGITLNDTLDYTLPSTSGTIALISDIPAVTGYVPYTGATQNVNLGEYELKAGQLTLDTTPTGTAVVGTTRWNDSIGTSETTLKGGSVILKNGVDLVARVVNKVTPNATLTKAAYQAVRISGAQGQRLAVAYAQANNDNNSADTIGLVCETIATNQEGFIMTVGQLEEINTTGSLQGETWVDGNVLYLSPTTPGALTNIKPTGLTGHIVVMGYVEYAHAIHGKIYVKIMNGWELDELHNVYINPATLANNDGLFYDSSDQLWKNETIASALGYTPQQQLISGTNIKTINGSSVLGSGDLVISGSNIYNANGTLTGNRTVTTGSNFLTFTTGSYGLKFGTSTISGIPVYYGIFGANVTPSQTNFSLSLDQNGNQLHLQAQQEIHFKQGANTRMFMASTTGNVLISTTPDAGFKLDVNGTARVQSTFRNADSQFGIQTSIGSTASNAWQSQIITAGSVQNNFFIRGFGINTFSTASSLASGTGSGILNAIAATGTTNDVFAVSVGDSIADNAVLRFVVRGNGEIQLANGATINPSSRNFTSGGALTIKAGNPRSDVGNSTGGNMTVAGGQGTGTGTSGDIIFSTSTPTTTGTTLQTLTQRWFIKGSSGILANVSTPNASAQLQVDSTTKGFLPPRMTTTEKNAIATPAAGLVVYDSTLARQSNYNGTAWVNLQPSAVQLGTQTLAFASWTLVGGYYTYTFSNANITSTSIVDFTPNNASINEVSSCLMLPQVDVASGSCTFYATFPPQSNITGTINIWQ